jgi:hypothetical protein
VWERAEDHLSEISYHGAQPTFWLPEQKTWIDVRRQKPDEDAFLDAADLAFSTHTCAAVIWGTIQEHHMYAFYLPLYEQGYYKDYTFSLCEACQQSILVCPMRGGAPDEYIGYCHRCEDIVLQHGDSFLPHPHLLAAYNAAHNARFYIVEIE